LERTLATNSRQKIFQKQRNFIFVDDVCARFDDGVNFRFQALSWRRDRRRRLLLLSVVQFVLVASTGF
jgi:hypothetical protein